MSSSTKPWPRHLLAPLALVTTLATHTWAQAPAPPPPNLAVIRRNATVSQIDRQNIQRWVDEQMDRLFSSTTLDVDAAQFRTSLLEHFQAGDATPDFRKVLAASVADSLSRRYKGTTSLTDPNLPRPLPVVYCLVVLALFDDPAAAPVLRQAMVDSSNPRAPAVRAVGLEGLIRLRDRLNQQTWTAVVADAQKIAADAADAVVLSRVYRLLAANTPDARAQEGALAILAILQGRLTQFEQKGALPSFAEREAAAWLGTRAVATQDARRINEITLQLGRLLADAAFHFTNTPMPPERKEELERVILVTEQSLAGIVRAKAAGKTPPNVTQALLTPGSDQAKRISDEVNKWIGTAAAPGLLNGAPFNLPAGLNIRRVVPTTATATAP